MGSQLTSNSLILLCQHPWLPLTTGQHLRIGCSGTTIPSLTLSASSIVFYDTLLSYPSVLSCAIVLLGFIISCSSPLFILRQWPTLVQCSRALFKGPTCLIPQASLQIFSHHVSLPSIQLCWTGQLNSFLFELKFSVESWNLTVCCYTELFIFVINYIIYINLITDNQLHHVISY